VHWGVDVQPPQPRAELVEADRPRPVRVHRLETPPSGSAAGHRGEINSYTRTREAASCSQQGRKGHRHPRATGKGWSHGGNPRVVATYGKALKICRPARGVRPGTARPAAARGPRRPRSPATAAQAAGPGAAIPAPPPSARGGRSPAPRPRSAPRPG
jgi:hypothetical protein